MRNFEILILIICAVTITYSTKHDKKGIKKKLPKITSENLEEEAKIDIASLLKDSKVNAVRNDGHNDADYISPIREHDPITARTQGKQSSQLIDQINKLINKVDNSAQRKGFDRDNEKNKHVKWYEDEREWDKEKTLRNRYHQFMKSLAVSHRNSVKNRVDDFLDVGVTEGEPGKLFLPKVQHMMKKMDLDHRGVVKERYIDDDSSGLRLRSSDDVIEVITQRFDDTKKLPPVEKNNNAAEVFLPTLASKREEEDVLFSDLMGGNLKVSKRGPQIDKAPTPNEDLNFNLVLRTGSLLNDSPGKTHRFDDRFRRSAFTQAGYTQDPDICKTYNENLMKLWSNLSKLFNVTDTPNERALHNIAIMIQAYLDHQNAKQTTETYKVKVEPPRDRTGEIILKVKKMVDDDEASAKAISRLIIKNMKPFYDDVENSECQKMNEESLTSSVDLLYRTYLENFDCRNEDDGSGLILRKRGGKNIQTLNSKWQTTNDDDRPAVKSILGEDELYKEITKGQVPRQRPGRKFRRIFRRSQTTNNGLFRSTAKNVNGSDKPKRVRLHAKPLAKKLRKSLLKTEMDNKTRCERFAIRKLSVSLRPVIDRFMSLLECELDNTLRSLKHEKVPTTPYNLYATVKESYKTEKPSLRQLKTRKDTSQSLDHVTRKTEIRNRYDMLTDNDNSLYEQTDEYPSSKQISAERITGNDFMSSIVDSFKVSDNDRSDGDNKTNDDAMFNDDRSNNKKAESKVKNRADDDREISFTDLLPETGLISRNQEKALRSAGNESPTENVTEADNPDKTNLRNDDRFNFGNSNQNQGAVNNYEDIKKFLNNARDASLKTPEFAVPFALDTSRGYVELTHLVKYPKVIVYRPQFIVKNTMPYDDFLKTVNNFNMTNDEVRLMKIVRHLPDNTVKVLFETTDFEAPLEVRNFRETRRWGLPLSTIKNLSQGSTDTGGLRQIKENDKLNDSNDNKDFDDYVDDQTNSKHDKIEAGKYFFNDKTIGRQLTLKSMIDLPSDSNYHTASESKDRLSIPRTGLLSSFRPGTRTSEIPTGSDIASSFYNIESGSDPTNKLLSKLNSIDTVQANAFINNLLSTFASQPGLHVDSSLNPEYIPSDPKLDAEFYSQLLDPNTYLTQTNSEEKAINTQKFGLDYIKYTADPSWWIKLKTVLLKRIQGIITRMSSLADNIETT